MRRYPGFSDKTDLVRLRDLPLGNHSARLIWIGTGRALLADKFNQMSPQSERRLAMVRALSANFSSSHLLIPLPKSEWNSSFKLLERTGFFLHEASWQDVRAIVTIGDQLRVDNRPFYRWASDNHIIWDTTLEEMDNLEILEPLGSKFRSLAQRYSSLRLLQRLTLLEFLHPTVSRNIIDDEFNRLVRTHDRSYALQAIDRAMLFLTSLPAFKLGHASRSIRRIALTGVPEKLERSLREANFEALAFDSKGSSITASDMGGNKGPATGRQSIFAPYTGDLKQWIGIALVGLTLILSMASTLFLSEATATFFYLHSVLASSPMLSCLLHVLLGSILFLHISDLAGHRSDLKLDFWCVVPRYKLIKAVSALKDVATSREIFEGVAPSKQRRQFVNLANSIVLHFLLLVLALIYGTSSIPWTILSAICAALLLSFLLCSTLCVESSVLARAAWPSINGISFLATYIGVILFILFSIVIAFDGKNSAQFGFFFMFSVVCASVVYSMLHPPPKRFFYTIAWILQLTILCQVYGAVGLSIFFAFGETVAHHLEYELTETGVKLINLSGTWASMYMFFGFVVGISILICPSLSYYLGSGRFKVAMGQWYISRYFSAGAQLIFALFVLPVSLFLILNYLYYLALGLTPAKAIRAEFDFPSGGIDLALVVVSTLAAAAALFSVCVVVSLFIWPKLAGFKFLRYYEPSYYLERARVGLEPRR